MLQADVLVIGSGAAGMYAAITAARAGGKVERLRRVIVELAEIAREGHQRAWVELLAGKHQHQVFEPGLADGFEVGSGNRLGKIHPADSGAAGVAEALDGQVRHAASIAPAYLDADAL